MTCYISKQITDYCNVPTLTCLNCSGELTEQTVNIEYTTLTCDECDKKHYYDHEGLEIENDN